MYEIKLTADTFNDLRQKVAILAADVGLSVSMDFEVRTISTTEVPLPESRVAFVSGAGGGGGIGLPEAVGTAQPPKRRGRPPKNRAPEPEETMHAASEPEELPDVDLSEPITVEPETVPELLDDIPEHMLDGPASIEEAQAELDAGEPVGLEADEEDEADGYPPEYTTFIGAVEKGAKTWQDIKEALRVFIGTDMFRAMRLDQQNRIRANVWEVVAERRHAGNLEGVPDHAEDLSAYRLWLEAQEDEDAIRGTFAVMKRGSSQWAQAGEKLREALVQATEARLLAIGL